MKRLLILLIILLLSACAPDPLKQSFDNAMLMVQRDNLKEAYPILKELCRKAPDNKEFCKEYDMVRNKLFKTELSKLSQKLSIAKSENTIIPLPILADILKNAEQLAEYNIKSREFDILNSQLNNEKRLSEEKRKEVLEKSKNLMANKKYLDAIELMDKNISLNREEFSSVISKFKEEALADLYPKILKAVEVDDWRTARPYIDTAYKINPDYKEIRNIYNDAQKKDTAEYYIKKADDAKRKRKYEEALIYYEKAMQYEDGKDAAKKLYDQTKIDLIEYHFQIAIELMEQELYKQAYDNFKSAFDILNTISVEKRRTVNLPRKELQKYYDSLYLKAKKAEDVGSFGVAYNYYKLINQLSPSYPEIKENLRKVEEKIYNRSLKSLAVIPFKSPKSAPEAGSIFTSNIMLSLYNELKQDLKIIERESMDVLLREYELTIAGKSQEGQAQKDSLAFQISSADYLLLGDVLDYKIDSSVQEGTRVVRVKTKAEFVPNPEYDEWLVLAKKLQAENKPIPPSPPKMLEKPVYEDIKYKVSFYKKVGILNVSYRVVDTAKGKIMHTSIVDIKKDVQDEASEGVEIGDFKVPFKMAQLPTDNEIMKKAQEDAVAKITGELKMLFLDPEEKLLKQAEALEREGNLKEAIERFTDSLILKKRKGKNIVNIEEKISKYLDAISAI